MKLVIDIPEEMYYVLHNEPINAFYNIYDLVHVIYNGTPLPKGHGRIIDESQVTGTFIWDNGYIECHAPTIIEADKAESEDKE